MKYISKKATNTIIIPNRYLFLKYPFTWYKAINVTRYENGKEKTSWNCKYGLTDFKSIGRHAQKTYRIGNIKNDFK